MPSYVLLLKYTDEGMQNIKYLPQHVNAFRQVIEAAGGHLPHVYLTMGQYDLVALIDAPTDHVCVSIVLALCSVGNVRSTTLKAFTEEELPDLAESVPSLEDDFSRILSQFGPTEA